MPEGTSVTTPSGMTIFYCPEPRHYKVNGVEVPSVTTVLQILHKPSLIWWGMKVGVEGLSTLYRGSIDQQIALAMEDMDVDSLIGALTREKLTVNHVRDKAGTRGTSVHMAFERWAEGLGVPDPESYPEEERGYVRGLVAFLEAVQPEPIHSELMVGSAKKGFAGRFDLLAYTDTDGKEIRPTPRKKRVVPEGTGIWDLKTGKGIYPDSHYLQLAAYRFACEESGYGRVDYEAVVNVREDGSWDVGISDRQPWQFLAVKTAWEALQ